MFCKNIIDEGSNLIRLVNLNYSRIFKSTYHHYLEYRHIFFTPLAPMRVIALDTSSVESNKQSALLCEIPMVTYLLCMESKGVPVGGQFTPALLKT